MARAKDLQKTIEKTLPTTNLAHYRGQVELDENRIFGPDTCGARYKMIHVEYDAEKDCSTVYFKPYLGEPE